MMKKSLTAIVISHILLTVLVVVVLLPSGKPTVSPAAMLCAVALAECYYLYQLLRSKIAARIVSELVCILWCFLLLWETMVTKFNMMQPVLFPAPENVFNVFATQYPVMLSGIVSSLSLLTAGLLLGIGLGVFLGLFAGSSVHLSGVFSPIAQLFAQIPPIIYSPYLVAIMPTFRSASALVIFLGIFFPTFLNMVLRVRRIEPKIVDTARTMGLRGSALVFKVFLPYVLPEVIGRLKITLSTSIMLLLFAEMMGATSGMGYYIVNYVHYANYTNVVAGIILVGLVITLLNKVVDVIQQKTLIT